MDLLSRKLLLILLLANHLLLLASLLELLLRFEACKLFGGLAINEAIIQLGSNILWKLLAGKLGQAVGVSFQDLIGLDWVLLH